MLSNTRGLQKRMAHAHRSDATFSTTLCPHIIQRGSCPEYAFEQTLRRRLVNLREESLKAEAVRLLTLEHEVAESEKEEAEGVAPPAAGATATGGNVWRPKFDDIAAVIETMKREKAYQDWSLDTAVAKELAKQSRRSCSYSHTDLRGAASSAGNADSLADDTSSTEGNQTTPIDTSLGEGRCPEAWRKQFQCLNPYQKLALLLLLRTRIRVPVGNLVSDVEELVRDARRTQKRQLNGGESDDDEDDEDEEISAEDIEATSKRLVTRTLVDVQRGLVNLSYYPHIVSYAVREPQDAFGYGPPSSTEEEEEGKQTTQSTPPPVASMSSSSVAAASTANKEMVHLCRCLCWDLISRHQPHHANNKSGETTEHKDHHPTPQSKAHVRRALIALGIPKSISAKEVDLSSSRRTGELFAVLDVLAVWWSHMVKYLEVASMSLLQQQQQHQRVSTNKATGVSIPFRLLSLRGCCLSSAEELIALVRKHGYQHTLVGLDLSSNRLDSLRFLFQLRAEFKDRLLFLGLKGNPITKKPDYREQVRATLPMLVSLDGEPIRRPPLSLPFPKSSELPSDVKPTDYAKVVATLERFLYVFETQQVPNINTVTGGDNNSTTKKSGKQHDQRVKKQHRTEIQQQRNEMDPFSIAMDTLRFVFDGKDYIDHSKSLESISDDDDDDTPITAAGAGEVEADENTFAKKYLDQDCCTTIFASNGCAWFDETTMRTAIEVELDSNYTGCRMSGQDVKELRVMDVSVRNHSRNLLVGKPALHRVARGPVNCFTMYQSTLYPQRMKASHEIQRVQVHVIGSEDDSVIVPKVTTSAPAASSAAPAKPKPVTRDPYAAKALPQAILDRMKRAVGKLHPMQECGPQLAPQVGASDVFRRAGEEAAADADGNSSSAHGGSSSRRPKVFVVTLHGVMRWRAPTMASEECITSAFHRTITLVPRPPAPPQPQPKRRRRGALDTAAAATSGKGSEPPLLIVNDMILLQPVVQDAEDDDDDNRARRYGGADSVCFTHMRSGKTRRLAIEYGLDHPSGLPLVQHVLERATSDAAAHMVLRRLVFDDENDDPSASALAGSQASLPQSSVLLRQNSSERIAREMTRLHSNQGALMQRQQTSLKIDSSLWISELQCNETSLLNNEENRGEGGGEGGAVAATTMKRRREMVSFAELDEMLVRANAECTTTFV